MEIGWNKAIAVFAVMIGVIISTSLLFDGVTAFGAMVLSSVIVVIIITMTPRDKPKTEVIS